MTSRTPSLRALSLDLDATFPIRRNMDFFNHAAVAPICGPAAKALEAYTRQASQKANVDADWYRRVQQTRAAAAGLIGAAGPDEIAFVPNTSTGLAQVAGGLGLGRGDQVVISNVEYPANRYPWEHLARTAGVELIEVAQRPDGRIVAEDVIEKIDKRTAVVSLSHVQFASGCRIDLPPISEAVHAVGGYLCVDGIQSVGAMPVDVKALGIDFLAADGHKWMLGPEGAGIFYCRRDLIDRLEPRIVGWMNMTHAMNFLDYRYEFAPDARRFEPGSYNIPGLLALGASLTLLEEVGMDVVWERIEALTARLGAGLDQRGCRIFSPRGEGERSGIVIFDPPGGTDAAGLVAALADRRIHVVVRGGRVRVSPHFYNDAQQVDRLLEALE